MSQTNSGETGTSAALMDRVRDGATSQLTTQKGRVTDSLTSLAQAVRQSTESLRNQQPAVAQYVERAASQLEHLSNRLRDRDVKDLVQDAQQFAPRLPRALPIPSSRRLWKRPAGSPIRIPCSTYARTRCQR